jgi:hypothetical protein
LPSANTIAFLTDSTTERARIDSSGRLLVGTSTARSNIYLGGSNPTPGVQFESVTNSYSAGLSLLNYSATGYAPVLSMGISQTNTQGTNTLIGPGTDFGIINFVGNDGGNFRTGAWIQATTDGTPASGSMPGRLVFSTTADGSASPTERMRITNTGQVRLAGAGITFNGDTATANELDDYEEGTWTPAVPGTSMTYTAQIGVYTKIGNLVYIRFYVNISGGTPSGSGGGEAIVTGLPFTSESTHFHVLTTSANGCNFGGTVPTAQVNPGGTFITAIGVTNNAGFVDSVPTNVWDATGNWVQACGCYRVP